MLPVVITSLLLALAHAIPSHAAAAPACDTIHPPRNDGTGMVFNVAPGPAGRVAWVDIADARRIPHVYVRDQFGKTHSVGRHGEGPGELHIVRGLSWRSDTLWLSDPQLRRMQAYTDTGRFLTGHLVPTGAGLAVGDRGTLLGWITVFPVPLPKEGISISNRPHALVSILAGNDRPDTLMRFPYEPFKNPGETPVQWPVFSSSADQRYWCAMGYSPAPGVRLTCVDNTGKAYLTGVHRFTPRPLTDAIWNSKVSYTLSSGGGLIDIFVPEHRAAMLPLGIDMMVNRNGDVWVLRSWPSEPTLIWDRIDRTGKPLPSISVPNHVHMRALDGAWYYAADTDDDGLQTLIRCAVP